MTLSGIAPSHSPSVPERSKEEKLDLIAQINNHAELESGAPAPSLSVEGRHCLVTVGATATFDRLVDEATTPEFISFLAGDGFTSMTLQCGL